MSVFAFQITVGIALVISILFCTAVILRLQDQRKKNPLPESRHTKLFKFIKAEYVAGLYIFIVAFHAVYSIYIMTAIS